MIETVEMSALDWCEGCGLGAAGCSQSRTTARGAARRVGRGLGSRRGREPVGWSWDGSVFETFGGEVEWLASAASG